MRAFFFPVVVVTQLLNVSLATEPETPARKDRDTPSIARLLDQWENGNGSQRESATGMLHEIAGDLDSFLFAENLHPHARSLVLMYEADSVDVEECGRLQKEVIALHPRLFKILRAESLEETSWALQRIVLTDTDRLCYESLVELKGTSLSHLWAVEGAYLGLGLHALPRTTAALSPIVKRLQSLPQAARTQLDDLWIRSKDTDSDPESIEEKYLKSLLGLGPTTLAIMMCNTDRVQIEIPQLAFLVRPEFPQIVRVMALSTLEQLGQEATPVLSAVRAQLTDEDDYIRLHAAAALIAIAPDSIPPEQLIKTARLKGEHANLIREAAKEHREFIEGIAEIQNEKFDSALNKEIRTYLQSHHQFYARQGLRTVILMGSDSAIIRGDIKEMTKWDELDKETSRLARLALAKLETKPESSSASE